MRTGTERILSSLDENDDLFEDKQFVFVSWFCLSMMIENEKLLREKPSGRENVVGNV